MSLDVHAKWAKKDTMDEILVHTLWKKANRNLENVVSAKEINKD